MEIIEEKQFRMLLFMSVDLSWGLLLSATDSGRTLVPRCTALGFKFSEIRKEETTVHVQI